MRFTRLMILVMLAAVCGSSRADQADDARSTATELIRKLGGALKQEMAAGGPAGAVSVCRDIAPGLASELSRRTGARVARVSLKPRNPLLGQADAWEQQVLMDFDRQAAEGQKPDTLERAEIVEEPQGRYFRYMKALPVQPLCLSCHGDKAILAEPVKAKLAAEYPHDRAFGYALGQIRGAVTIKQLIEARQ